jgi:hypothetical protein
VKRRWLIVSAGTIFFISFVWPTPAVTRSGKAYINLGAFWAVVRSDEGIPATPAMAIWILVGLALGGAISYWLQRRWGVKK